MVAWKYSLGLTKASRQVFIESFGEAPPEGTLMHWLPRGRHTCQRPILLTKGLVYRLTLAGQEFLAWTTVLTTEAGPTTGSPRICWGISIANSNDTDVESNHLVAPTEGPSPAGAFTQLCNNFLKCKLKCLRPLREILGFDQVLVVAQLERICLGGHLSPRWMPPCLSDLASGQFLVDKEAARFSMLPQELQGQLSHLCSSNTSGITVKRPRLLGPGMVLPTTTSSVHHRMHGDSVVASSN